MKPDSWLRGAVDRFLLCVFIAGIVATGLSAYALVLDLLGGQGPFEAHGTTVGEAILTYYLGAVLAALVVGLSLPLARNKWGAMFVGFLAAMPFYAAIRFAVEGFAPWTMEDSITLLLIAFTVGPMTGYGYYSVFRQ